MEKRTSTWTALGAAGAAAAVLVAVAVGSPTQSAPSAAGNTALAMPATSTPAPSDGYSRDQFGNGWARTGPNCDTRDTILRRDLPLAVQLNGCDVVAALGKSLYTDEALAENGADIDHVYSLKAAWDAGANRWTFEQRVEFANNPGNLVAVDLRSNRRKGEALPGAWMPSANACEYGQKVLAVAQTPVPSAPALHLPLAPADLAAVNRACTPS